MEELRYALELEKQISRMLAVMTREAPLLLPLIEMLEKHQDDMLGVLRSFEHTRGMPQTEALFPSLPDERLWQGAAANVQLQAAQLSLQSVWLWTIETLYERLAQYYRQAAQNTPVTNDKYFYSSAAEVKKTIKLRLAGINHMLANEVWGRVGFAPYILGKE